MIKIIATSIVILANNLICFLLFALIFFGYIISFNDRNIKTKIFLFLVFLLFYCHFSSLFLYFLEVFALSNYKLSYKNVVFGLVFLIYNN